MEKPLFATIRFLGVVFLLSQLGCPATSKPTSPRTTFRAAVYSHDVILPTRPARNRSQALDDMKKNLDIYRTQARVASKQGADIIVFPEDGIYGMVFATRDSIEPYLEYVPYPYVEHWSPCDDPYKYPDTEVQQALSCMAKENSLYLVANMGDKHPCNKTEDPQCPPDGRYQFNTDVAFGPDGKLLSRYFKAHLFGESQFNEAYPEVQFFDTPFGRFGMMTCFDVLFAEPAVEMVVEMNISNIVFPTAWMDALPILSAIGFHSSFAHALGINFLSSNIHKPFFRLHGSGVYTPKGMKKFYYGRDDSFPPKLVVTDVDIVWKPQPNINVTALSSYQKSRKGNCEEHQPRKENSHRQAGNVEFNSYLFNDDFTFKTLDEPRGSVTVCQNDICCELQYTKSPHCHKKELFAFGAFDGLHVSQGQYYTQICTLIKCADPNDIYSCGAVTFTSTTMFSHIEIRAHMQTPYIYPQVIVSDSRGNLQLTPADHWTFSVDTLTTSKKFDHEVLSASLYGRYYSRDNCTSLPKVSSDESFFPEHAKGNKFDFAFHKKDPDRKREH